MCHLQQHYSMEIHRIMEMHIKSPTEDYIFNMKLQKYGNSFSKMESLAYRNMEKLIIVEAQKSLKYENLWK